MKKSNFSFVRGLGFGSLLLLALAVLPARRETPAAEARAGKSSTPDYARDVAPIFRKYCLGCHNAQEAQGGLVLESHHRALRGGEHGAVVVAGDAVRSKLIRVLEKRAEPPMPPEGNQGPTTAEIGVLKAWIQAGARGPNENAPGGSELVTPKIEPRGKPRAPINALAYSPDGRWLAVARYAMVEVLSAADRKLARTMSGISGNVNDVGFSADGRLLFAAAGEAGLFGELSVWSAADWTRRHVLRGHRDSLLAARISPDGKTLATASYDQTIRLWDAVEGKPLRVLAGHNGPVFDVAFDPTGRLLASASGDRTVKLWDVATGERLDTFSQPTKDQYAVAFTPDGQTVIAAGVDSRIRVWHISPSAKEGTNEIVRSIFAHDGPIIRLAVSRDGRFVASSSEDRTIKIWDALRMTQLRKLADQSDWTAAMAISPDNQSIAAGRLDGSLTVTPVADGLSAASAGAQPLDDERTPAGVSASETKLYDRIEREPNNTPDRANELPLPAKVSGVLTLGPDAKPDVDLFRFHARAGESWVLETEAARKNSPADTTIDVLNADGSSVVRCLLRAVRDSAVTFRPIDSRQGGLRLENWQEMDLDQFLYMSGEVCRLFRAPRGPDSEYNLYTSGGSRRGYFDTSAVSHALNEPVYIVEAYPAGTRLPDNGLPIFPLPYSNDDDGSRKLGRDSRLVFTAPAAGTYLARVRDTRDYGGPDFRYALTIRRPNPDFVASVSPMNPKVPAGGGRQFVVSLDRRDDFDGEVRVDVTGLPAGYHISSPLVVQKGHNEANGTINADADAKPAKIEVWKSMRMTARAEISGHAIVKSLGGLGAVQLAPPPKLVVRLRADASARDQPAGQANEIVIEPGQMAPAMLRVERHGYQGELRFEVENLPHGVIVDNIGLSGIMIRAGETERQIFLSAAKWVSPTERPIHAVADREGNQTSLPIRLRVAGKAP